MRPVVVKILLLLLVACLVGAGCGASDRGEYERELAKVGDVVDGALDALPTNEASAPGPEEIGTLADDLREAANQLDDLDPPDDAKDAQKRLGRGLRGVATAFDSLAGDLRGASTDTAKAALFVAFATDASIDRAFEDLAASQDAYTKAGYRVFRSDIEVPAPKPTTK